MILAGEDWLIELEVTVNRTRDALVPPKLGGLPFRGHEAVGQWSGRRLKSIIVRIIQNRFPKPEIVSGILGKTDRNDGGGKDATALKKEWSVEKYL